MFVFRGGILLLQHRPDATCKTSLARRLSCLQIELQRLIDPTLFSESELFALAGERFLNVIGPAYPPVNERISLINELFNNSLVSSTRTTE